MVSTKVTDLKSKLKKLCLKRKLAGKPSTKKCVKFNKKIKKPTIRKNFKSVKKSYGNLYYPKGSLSKSPGVQINLQRNHNEAFLEKLAKAKEKAQDKGVFDNNARPSGGTPPSIPNPQSDIQIDSNNNVVRIPANISNGDLYNQIINGIYNDWPNFGQNRNNRRVGDYNDWSVPPTPPNTPISPTYSPTKNEIKNEISETSINGGSSNNWYLNNHVSIPSIPSIAQSVTPINAAQYPFNQNTTSSNFQPTRFNLTDSISNIPSTSKDKGKDIIMDYDMHEPSSYKKSETRQIEPQNLVESSTKFPDINPNQASGSGSNLNLNLNPPLTTKEIVRKISNGSTRLIETVDKWTEELNKIATSAVKYFPENKEKVNNIAKKVNEIADVIRKVGGIGKSIGDNFSSASENVKVIFGKKDTTIDEKMEGIKYFHSQIIKAIKLIPKTRKWGTIANSIFGETKNKETSGNFQGSSGETLSSDVQLGNPIPTVGTGSTINSANLQTAKTRLKSIKPNIKINTSQGNSLMNEFKNKMGERRLKMEESANSSLNSSLNSSASFKSAQSFQSSSDSLPAVAKSNSSNRVNETHHGNFQTSGSLTRANSSPGLNSTILPTNYNSENSINRNITLSDIYNQLNGGSSNGNELLRIPNEEDIKQKNKRPVWR